MLGQRIITAALFGGAILAAVLIFPYAWAVLVFGLLWLAGAWEWAKLASLDGAGAIAFVAALGALMGLALGSITPAFAAYGMAGAAVWWTLALLAVIAYPLTFPPALAAAAGLAVLVPSWVILCYVHAAVPLGRGLAMTAIAIVWAADVGAYFTGRTFGRHKLAPKVSPGKTWEGVTGGALAAAVVGAACGFVMGLPAGTFALLAAGTALVSVVGDLTVSMFKRNVGLKDSGKLLPGHGGVLDRIDSLTAAIPVYALGLKAAGLLA